MAKNDRTRTRSRSANRWSLSERMALEAIISDISACFVDLPVDSAHEEVRQTFERLLKFFKLDRLALWEFVADRDEFVLLHCRQAKDIPFPPPRTDAKHFHWAMGKLLRAEPIVIRGAGELPETAREVREYFEQQGIRSWLAVPLRNNGEVFGALVFVAIHKEVEWTTQMAAQLQTIADIVGGALARVRAEQGWRQSESLNNSIMNSLGNSVVVIDRNGRIVAVSAKWAESASNNSDNSLAAIGVGLNYLDFWRENMNARGPERQQAFAGIQSVLEGSQHIFEFEYACQSLEKQRWFEMTVRSLARREGGAVISHTDITSRKKTEAKLRESEERFGKMTDQVPVIVWMHGLEKNLTYINTAGLHYSGLPEKAYLGRKWLDHIHPEDLQKGWGAYEKAFDSRQKFMVEYRHLHVSGQYRWLLTYGGPRFLPDGTFTGYIGVSVDIHDRKEAEEGRLQVTGRLLHAQEEERSRIGRELHDDFAQRLALLTIKLQEMEQATVALNERERMAELRKQANQLSVDLAQLSHRLHSSYLENFGLAAAVKSQCNEISRLHQIEISCEIRDLPPIVGKTIALTLFRVLQEALHNAVKHSHATRVGTELFADGKEIWLRVADNGVGFNPTAPNVSAGLGLISMKERLYLVGGDLSISSQPFLGTKLEAHVPLASGAKRVVNSVTSDPQQPLVA